MAPSYRWLLFALVSVTFAMAQDAMVKVPEGAVGAVAPLDLAAEGSEVQEAVVAPHPMPEEGDMVEMGRSPRQHHSQTAAGVLKKIYAECISKGSFACAKPKVLAFLSSAAKRDSIPLTEDMAIVRKEGVEHQGEEEMVTKRGYNTEEQREDALKMLMLDRADTFLDTHTLRIRVPKEIVSGELVPLVPKFLLQNIPAEVNIPLSEGRAVQERGFVKKVVIPFLLGLKFKATALIPLALSLIAMKTWKALTLGLLSLVLSGAMVIFRLSKPPKVVSYEVYHYPQAPHAIEVPAAHGWDPHHSYAKNSRSLDSMPLAYRAHYRH